jgi:uncharacterized membrane protein YfcA/uncharacterized membrane protein
MDIPSSNQLLAVTKTEESQPAVEPSQDDHTKTIQTKDYTSSIIGWILQGGVILSASIILIGLLMLLLNPAGFSVSELLSFPHSFGQVWSGLLALHPQAIIALGLMLLIATPVLRVAVSIVAFALERDVRFVVITAIVLVILLLSNVLLGNIVGSTDYTSVQQFHFSLPVVLLIFGGSIAAGLLGSLIGLGGGVLIVPLLTLAFGLPISYAIGASIVSVIATSSGAAAAYVRDHLTNLRVGMFLELGTTTGAITGAFLAALFVPDLLFVLFGVILLVSAVPQLFKIGEELPEGVKNDRLAKWLKLSGKYPDQRMGRQVPYQVTRTPLGLAMMYVAGILSGLLGIGSGSFKVLAMDTAMRLPMKVSTTTSNFMIGVTAAASAGIYFSRGDIPPLIAAPVALGVLLGALIGSRLLTRLSNKTVRLIFLPVLAIIAFQMVMRGLGIAL